MFRPRLFSWTFNGHLSYVYTLRLIGPISYLGACYIRNLHLLTTRVNTSHRFSMITQAPSAKLQNTISGLKWTGGIRDSELVSHAMTCPDAGKRHSRIYAAGRPTHDRSISSDALPTYEMLEPSEHAYLHRTGLYAWPLRGSD